MADSERYDLFGNVGLDMTGWDTGMTKLLKDSSLLNTKWLAAGGAIAAVAAGLVECVKESANFESAMSNIETVVGKGNDSFLAQLANDVKSLSKIMPFSQTELARTLYDIISYGVPAADAMDLLKTSAEAAVGGFADVNDTFKLFGSIIKGYGLEWDNATEVADKMFFVAGRGASTISELASSIGGVVPFAKNLGVTLNEVYAVMSTLPGVTGTTSEAATQLTSVMVAMMDPATKMKKAFADLGVASGQELISKMGGLQGALMALEKYAKQHNMAIGEMLGRKEAQLAFFNLVGTQAGEYAKNLKDVATTTGLAKEAFATKSADMTNQWKMLMNEIKLLMSGIGDAAIPLAKVLLEVGTGLTQTVGQIGQALGYVDQFITGWTVKYFENAKNVINSWGESLGFADEKIKVINRELLLHKEAAADAADRGIAPLWKELDACDAYMMSLNNSMSDNVKLTEEETKQYTEWVKSLRQAAREQLPALNFQLNEMSDIMANAGGIDELGLAAGLGGYVDAVGDYRGEWKKIPDLVTDVSDEVDELNKKTNKGTGYVDNMNKSWVKTAGYILNVADNLFDANSKAGKLVDTAQSIALGFATGGVAGAVVAAAAAIAGPLTEAVDEFFNGFQVDMHWGENYVADPTTNYQEVYDEAIKRGDEAMAEWALEMLNKAKEPMHTGGFPRTAHSGYLASSEVDVRMLKNEMVLRPEATDKFGAQRLLDFNRSLDPSVLGGQRPVKVVFHNATKQSWAEIVDDSIYPRMKEKERRFEVAGNPY